MIATSELQQLRSEWSLDLGVIEKDYVLGWLLAGIAQHPALAESWVFKGGTCLRKCFYETFRFSEDLDFTIVAGGPEEPEQLVKIFSEIAAWLLEESDVQIVVDEKVIPAPAEQAGSFDDGRSHRIQRPERIARNSSENQARSHRRRGSR